MRGFQFESFATCAFLAAGYTQARVGIGAIKLLKAMLPQRLDLCRQKLWDAQGVDIFDLAPADILDQCVSLDRIFISPDKKKVIGVDFSTCPGKDYGKRRKMNAFASYYKKANITHWDVVNEDNLHEKIKEFISS